MPGVTLRCWDAQDGRQWGDVVMSARQSALTQPRDVPSTSAVQRGGTVRGMRLVLYAALLTWTLFTLLPILWALAASLTPQDRIFEYLTPFTPRAFWPEQPTLSAYHELLTNPLFLRALANTFGLCAATVVGGIAVNSLAGFAFTVFDFPGKRLLMVLVFVSFMVPFEAIVIPLFGIVNALQLTDSYAALLLPTLANGAVIYMFRQFFADTPRDLIEAARIDGLSWFGVYYRIVLPLSKPVLISAGLALFLVQWESFFWPLLVANSPQYQVVQQALANFNTQYTYRWDIQLAGAVLTMAMPTVLLAFLQRYYVTTIANTGSKD